MDEAQSRGLWHRISRVMLHDPKTNTYLLQMVPPNPYYNGGLWNTTASGHVDERESYERAAMRELFEEMGISVDALEEVESYSSEDQKESKGDLRIYRRFNKTFISSVDSALLHLVPNSQEVEATMWASPRELLELVHEGKVTAALSRFVDQQVKAQNGN